MFGIFRRFRKTLPQNVWAAAVYLRGQDLIIHAQNRTYNNVGWNSDPAVAMKADAGTARVGSVVRSALRASRWDAPGPDPDGADNPVLKAAGVSSWPDLERESRLVSVALENGQISIYNYRPARASEGKGFVQMDDTAPLSIPGDAADDELGGAVIEGLKRSIPSPGR
jgi:hypothetical protein